MSLRFTSILNTLQLSIRSTATSFGTFISCRLATRRPSCVPGARHHFSCNMSTLKRKNPTLGTSPDAKKTKHDGNIASFFGAPKPAAASNGAVSAKVEPLPAQVKFNKDKWVAGLTDEQKELLQLEIDTLDVSWLSQLKDDIVTKEFLDLKRFLRQETKNGKKWFPPAEDVYSWSRHTPFHDVKVVILGQDPYHNVNQAHGMAFSVRPPTIAPPSLRNMYQALQKDYPQFVLPPNRGGYLMPWADSGVLMLNTCLTVRAHEAFSHANRGWEKLTQKVIDLIAQKRTRGVVFMAWGSPAGKRVQKVDKVKHLVLQAVHPSPLSANRGPKFFKDCGHFRAANEWLIKRYGPEGEIDWALTPNTTTKEVGTAKPTEPKESAGAKVADAKAEAAVAKQNNGAAPKLATAAVGDELDDIDSDEEAALNEAVALAEAQSSQAAKPDDQATPKKTEVQASEEVDEDDETETEEVGEKA